MEPYTLHYQSTGTTDWRTFGRLPSYAEALDNMEILGSCRRVEIHETREGCIYVHQYVDEKVWGAVLISAQDNGKTIGTFMAYSKIKMQCYLPEYPKQPIGEWRYYDLPYEPPLKEGFPKEKLKNSHEGMIYNPYNKTWGWGF